MGCYCNLFFTRILADEVSDSSKASRRAFPKRVIYRLPWEHKTYLSFETSKPKMAFSYKTTDLIFDSDSQLHSETFQRKIYQFFAQLVLLCLIYLVMYLSLWIFLILWTTTFLQRTSSQDPSQQGGPNEGRYHRPFTIKRYRDSRDWGSNRYLILSFENIQQHLTAEKVTPPPLLYAIDLSTALSSVASQAQWAAQTISPEARVPSRILSFGPSDSDSSYVSITLDARNACCLPKWYVIYGVAQEISYQARTRLPASASFDVRVSYRQKMRRSFIGFLTAVSEQVYTDFLFTLRVVARYPAISDE